MILQKKQIHSNDVVKLEIIRSGKKLGISFRCPSKPLEKMEGVETIYGEVKSSLGYYTQTITTRPTGTKEKLPGIFFVGWLSCDPIELNPKNMDGWAQLIQDFATKSGMVFMRAERPGLGDSQGPACENCDLRNDMAAFRAAFSAFKKLDFVDSTKIFVFGGSIGGALAPVLMQDEKIKGLIVAGTFGRTWFEHFMDFERKRLELSGKSFSEVNQSMNYFAEFYTDYLIQRRMPKEITDSKSYLKDIWYDEPTAQFGRPAAYHQQVQQLDVPGAWQKISCPVMSIYGEYDWIMSKQENEYIAYVVNAIHPGKAEFHVIPKKDHHFSIYKTPQEAFEGAYVNYSKDVFPLIMNWVSKGLNTQ